MWFSLLSESGDLLARQGRASACRAADALALHTNEEAVLTNPKQSPFFSSSLLSPKLKPIIITILQLSLGKRGLDWKGNQLF